MLTLHNYQNKKIIILGMGKTGLSCLEFFLSHKIIPKIIDTRISPPEINKIPPGIKYHLGNLNTKWLLSADLIVISPGISIYTSKINKIVNKSTEIISDIELFCRVTNTPIIAITGSNGKSTVATILKEMAKKANLKVSLGGNIGTPVLKLLKKKCDFYIIEVSSFQLETIHNLKSIAATILNITPDHLDRYPKGFYQYQKTKLKIYNDSKICIFNKQDLLTWPVNNNNKSISFGINSGYYKLNTISNKLIINNNSIINVSKTKLIGKHNYINMLAALALADVAKIPRKASLITLTEYKGLPHRYQLIHKNNNIKWINDSKSTNIGSTIAALKNLQNETGIVYLLLGGDGKSADFSLLIPFISNKNIFLCCFGKDGKKFANLKKNSLFLHTMEECIRYISKKLKPGDVVLLSPACASFDQFNNFEERGILFTKLAHTLG